MNAHTPGPWAVSKSEDYLFGQEQGNGLLPIGFVYGPAFPDRSDLGKRALADTKLVAAAPELLEALKACLQCFYEMTGRKPAFVEDSIAMGKEALAKATGEQP